MATRPGGEPAGCWPRGGRPRTWLGCRQAGSQTNCRARKSKGFCAERVALPAAFTKSEILFNMHRAAAGMEKSVVVVEGFFDCMKVHQANVRSVVGLMGSVLFEP